MKATVIIINAGTAFVVSAGTALGCVLIATKGQAPDKWSIISCIISGLVVAAKDTRSFLKLPPVNDNQQQNNT